jgi:hypothetical protein
MIRQGLRPKRIDNEYRSLRGAGRFDLFDLPVGKVTKHDHAAKYETSRRDPRRSLRDHGITSIAGASAGSSAKSEIAGTLWILGIGAPEYSATKPRRNTGRRPNRTVFRKRSGMNQGEFGLAQRACGIGLDA